MALKSELLPVAGPQSERLRSHTASAKLTDAEFAELEGRALKAGKRPGEWVREVLLRELAGQGQQLLLAEVIGVRMIVLNLFSNLARGDKLSADDIQRLIAEIDAQKSKRASERIKQSQLGQLKLE